MTLLRSNSRLRPAFTLLELLVTIVIIGLLAAALVPSLYSVAQLAKRARTEQIITKLNEHVLARWEKYQTLRLPIDASSWVTSGTNVKVRTLVAERRLNALRELIRIEMPDRYDDLTFTPQYLVANTGGSGQPIIPELQRTYSNYIKRFDPAKTLTAIINERDLATNHESAECLHMMLTQDLDDSDLMKAGFSEREVGDKDNDGMPEFIDGWGNPIEFLRWAPGFDSDRQPVYQFSTFSTDAYGTPAASYPASSKSGGVVTTRYPVQHHDSFDSIQVDKWLPSSSGYERGFFLSPLIVSAGPDENFGLFFLRGTGGPGSSSDPYLKYIDTNGDQRWRGERMDDDASYDNIHNHQIGVR